MAALCRSFATTRRTQPLDEPPARVLARVTAKPAPSVRDKQLWDIWLEHPRPAIYSVDLKDTTLRRHLSGSRCCDRLPLGITMLRSFYLSTSRCCDRFRCGLIIHKEGLIGFTNVAIGNQFLSGRCRYDVASSAPDWRRSMTRRTGLSRAVGARLAKPRGLGQSGPCGWPGMGRSEERPSFDGLCPALTQNGMESRTLPVRFSLDAQKRSGGLRYFWQCVHMPVSLQAPLL